MAFEGLFQAGQGLVPDRFRHSDKRASRPVEDHGLSVMDADGRQVAAWRNTHLRAERVGKPLFAQTGGARQILRRERIFIVLVDVLHSGLDSIVEMAGVAQVHE